MAKSKGTLSLLFLGSLLLSLMLAEAVLRLSYSDVPYTVLRPGRRWEFDPAPGAMPGIEGLSVYSVNSAGIRGDEMRPGTFNILAIGGSATQGRYLDDRETWPFLLQEKLNAAGAEPPRWVGNIGRSGHGLVEHIYHLRYFVPQHAIDTVLVMAGVNDLLPVLAGADDYRAEAETPAVFGRTWHNAFSGWPFYDPAVPRRFPTNLALWNLGEKTWWYLEDERRGWGALREDRAGQNYFRRRALLQAAPEVLSHLPDLAPALERYEQNLHSLVDEANAQGVRPILITQPAVWKEELSDRFQALLWLGYRGDPEAPSGRYTPGALAEGLRRFNDLMLLVCRQKRVECVDLATAMNANEAYYYDGLHLNELGAEAAASFLAAALGE